MSCFMNPLISFSYEPAQDGIIQRLTTQISRMDELAKSGRHSSLSLLTREASDVRFQQYEARLREQEAEIAELKKFVGEKDKELKAKDGESACVHSPPYSVLKLALRSWGSTFPCIIHASPPFRTLLSCYLFRFLRFPNQSGRSKGNSRPRSSSRGRTLNSNKKPVYRPLMGPVHHKWLVRAFLYLPAMDSK
jgi:hypothetical protein